MKRFKVTIYQPKKVPHIEKFYFGSQKVLMVWLRMGNFETAKALYDIPGLREELAKSRIRNPVSRDMVRHDAFAIVEDRNKNNSYDFLFGEQFEKCFHL